MIMLLRLFNRRPGTTSKPEVLKGATPLGIIKAVSGE